ncbi:O-acetylhomoserine aminocarboxypropyltransferase/cysteine synthase family protein [Sporolactobacillus laevolacticus]|uniref:O-acetylhomoserine aminocarboxypropyltransferase/cysteine synthase family protein n=1 Tax=Sporolactobacillus laevolacticus TaxID=33018 RepID=UPI0025B55715|nr:aminotransferase class I/II-fold pyridoxal phosphate-dependent enzyme [Sporolactobacillus laevolacticus]MDN3954413.1 aminotransferase class I/II-fold pyridoxal phosphate-dependent enzyme [Sporolactobacillus laevolacticus]
MAVESEKRFDTLKIHAGYDPKQHNYASQVPIYQTVAFGFSDPERAERLVNLKEKGFSYTRVGNPTTDVLEKRIAELDGGSEAVAVGSGMAAVSYTLLNLAEGGGRIITAANIYGTSFDEFRTLFPKFGITFDFIDDINDLDRVEAKIRDDTKAIFAESVTNPDTNVTHVEALAALAHKHGIPLVIDNTFPTPYLFNPIHYGADIVVYSSTKGISGHGEVVSGLIVDAGKFDYGNGRFKQFEEKEFVLGDEEAQVERSFTETFGTRAFAARIRVKYLRLLGAVLSPIESYFVLLGIETLSERLKKQVASAEKIASFLAQNPHVKAVHYSGLSDHPQHELVNRYFPRGVGAIFAFEIDGTEAQAKKILNYVKIFSYLPNVGDARSLIVNPGRTTHREIPSAYRRKSGLTNTLLRLSIGLEDADDLIGDLDQAIRQAFV